MAKLRLTSGSVTEDINLVPNVPTPPYLEVKENNSIAGYARLSNSGRGKFTFNNMYVKSMPQSIYGGGLNTETVVFDTNLNRKTSILSNGTSPASFRGYTDYDVYALSRSSNDSPDIIHINAETHNPSSKYPAPYIRRIVTDSEKNVYAYTVDSRNNIYKLIKVPYDGSPSWEVIISKFYDVLEIDGNNMIYLHRTDYYYGVCYDNKGNKIKDFTFNNVIRYISKSNKIYATSSNYLYIYDLDFNILQSISISSSDYGIIVQAFPAGNAIGLVSSKSINGFRYYRVFNYDLSTGQFFFQAIEIPYNRQLVVDQESNLFVLTSGSVLKYNTSGRRVATGSICKYPNDVSGIAISGDRE